MKFPVIFLGLLTVAARATNIGDSYQAVLAERGAPKSQMEAGANLILSYPDATIKLRDKAVVTITPLKPTGARAASSPAPTVQESAEAQIAAVKREQAKATARITAIVNQPVAPVPFTKGKKPKTLPYWFHEGAITPDFAKVDVRTTRETKNYEGDGFIHSDLSPETYYRCSDLEFNPMTKYFYTDRTVPKKRLTEDEMVEINGLYRVLARCEQKLLALKAP